MLINSKCGAGLVQGAMPTARANPCRLSCTWATRRWLVHHEACSDHCWRNVRNISHNVKRCHYVCSHKSNFCVSEWVSTLVSHPTQYRSFRRRSNFCVQPHCCVSPLPCFKLLKRSFGPTQIYSFPVAPERIWKWGRHTSEKFFVVPLHFFGSTSTISRFDERFRHGHYSLVSFLFAVVLLTVPRAQPLVKAGERSTCPHVPYGVGAAVIVSNFINVGDGYAVVFCCWAGLLISSLWWVFVLVVLFLLLIVIVLLLLCLCRRHGDGQSYPGYSCRFLSDRTGYHHRMWTEN